MPALEIVPGRFISNKQPCFIIAEIGQNHQGDIDCAKNLIEEARNSGADCVKFQKTNLIDKFTKNALEKPYHSENSWGETYGEHKNFLEFSEEEFRELKLYADSLSIYFTASAKDIVSLKFLVNLNVPFIKIGSGDSDDFLLLKEAAVCGKPLIVSTGMQDLNTVHQIYKTVKDYHNNFVLMHCVSSYPTEPNDVNLRIIQQYKKEFTDINIGYSGHEMGTVISVAAVALGATVIERHITLDKNQKGSDHSCSLLPEEFKTMVSDIRIIESALGSPYKCFMPCESACYDKLGKSLVAVRDLAVGTIISDSDIKIKVSYPKGIPAKGYWDVIGSTLKRSVECDNPIMLQDIVFRNEASS